MAVRSSSSILPTVRQGMMSLIGRPVGSLPLRKGGDEFLQLPALHDLQARPDGGDLARDAAGQILAVARATVGVRQDVFAVFGCRALMRGG